jgi:hypothetical protein
VAIGVQASELLPTMAKRGFTFSPDHSRYRCLRGKAFHIAKYQATIKFNYMARKVVWIK